MIALICLIWSVSTALFKSKSRLEVENAALRHQVVVLQRKVRGRIEFTNWDRLFFVLLYRWCPSVVKAMMIVRPETVVRWHRAGFRRYWRWKSRGRGGRPPISAELRALIRPELERVPAQSCSKYRSDGPVCDADHRLRSALCSGDCPAGSARTCLDQCHAASHGGLDRAADHRSFSVE
jgi:hypothetical protein